MYSKGRFDTDVICFEIKRQSVFKHMFLIKDNDKSYIFCVFLSFSNHSYLFRFISRLLMRNNRLANVHRHRMNFLSKKSFWNIPTWIISVFEDDLCWRSSTFPYTVLMEVLQRTWNFNRGDQRFCSTNYSNIFEVMFVVMSRLLMIRKIKIIDSSWTRIFWGRPRRLLLHSPSIYIDIYLLSSIYIKTTFYLSFCYSVDFFISFEQEIF